MNKIIEGLEWAAASSVNHVGEIEDAIAEIRRLRRRLDTLSKAVSGSVGFGNGSWISAGEDWEAALDEVADQILTPNTK